MMEFKFNFPFVVLCDVIATHFENNLMIQITCKTRTARSTRRSIDWTSIFSKNASNHCARDGQDDLKANQMDGSLKNTLVKRIMNDKRVWKFYKYEFVCNFPLTVKKGDVN